MTHFVASEEFGRSGILKVLSQATFRVMMLTTLMPDFGLLHSKYAMRSRL